MARLCSICTPLQRFDHSLAFYLFGGIVNLGTRLSFGQLKTGSSTPNHF